MSRGLGLWQKAILAALKNRGPYYSGCGWRCGNLCHRHTVRMLETLVARGLVVKAEDDVYHLAGE
jgi:hypothetical protein